MLVSKVIRFDPVNTHHHFMHIHDSLSLPSSSLVLVSTWFFSSSNVYIVTSIIFTINQIIRNWHSHRPHSIDRWDNMWFFVPALWQGTRSFSLDDSRAEFYKRLQVWHSFFFFSIVPPFFLPFTTFLRWSSKMKLYVHCSPSDLYLYSFHSSSFVRYTTKASFVVEQDDLNARKLFINRQSGAIQLTRKWFHYQRYYVRPLTMYFFL